MAGIEHGGKPLTIFEYTGERGSLTLQWVPQKVGRTLRPEVARRQPYGYNRPDLSYSGGNETIAFSVQFYATEDAPETVAKAMAFLRSLAQNNAGTGDQPLCGLAWGGMFRGLQMKLTGYNETAVNFADEHSYYPIYGEADLTFEVQHSRAQTWAQQRAAY